MHIICAIQAGDPNQMPTAVSVPPETFYRENGVKIKLPYFDQETCTVRVGTVEDQVIDLSRLARRDGKPMFEAEHNISEKVQGMKFDPVQMNYSFNPCVPFTFQPTDHMFNLRGDIGGTVASESTLTSAGTLLSRVRAPPLRPGLMMGVKA
ncbi:hypothetical protein PoB_004048800 [Plakobranchus ocellatus]|uniref:Uncharacterized protein n=1 Tax=Plakobranchus ocellatus TaxID=259542 RepID=A0AAV4B4H6_9GAST|nr:hypothetical protein PoB_004048800 [Plakobranchus ocellatus]